MTSTDNEAKFRSVTVACLAGLLTVSPTLAQSISDDFDGTSSVIWKTSPADGQGTSFAIGGGSLEISNSNLAFLVVDEFDALDISIRTQMKLEDGDFVGVSARYTPGQTPVDNVFAGIGSDGAVLGGFGSPTSSTVVKEKQTTLNATENDVNFQLDVIGDDVRYWVWPELGDRPVEPTDSFSHSDLGAGTIAVWATGDGPVGGAFRFVEVTVVPEPYSIFVFGIGILAVLGSIRRR